MYKTLFSVDQAHSDSVWSLAWGHNDKHEYLVTGSVDSSVKSWYWNGVQLESRHRFDGAKLGVVSVDIDASGTRAVSSSLDSVLHIWDLEGGAQIAAINAGPVNSWAVAFSPDARHIATGNNKGEVSLFEVASREKKAVLETRGAFVLSVAFSPNGKQLACGAIDGGVHVFDLLSGKQTHKVSEGHALPVRSLAFSPDGMLLLTASDDGTVKMFDAVGGQLTGTVSGHLSWVLGLACSPRGDQFATGSSDKTVKVWETRTRQCLHTFEGHGNQVWDVAYNRTGTKLASVSDDQSIRIMDCP